jgi:TPP-dependent pyruvate/acetoin dehydrogenase alpha subunit
VTKRKAETIDELAQFILDNAYLMETTLRKLQQQCERLVIECATFAQKLEDVVANRDPQ